MSELIKPTQKKCSSCYYGFKVVHRTWGCAYCLRRPADSEQKMRILKPDGTLQYEHGYCDKYIKGRVPDYLWFEEGFVQKDKRRVGIDCIVKEVEE